MEDTRSSTEGNHANGNIHQVVPAMPIGRHVRCVYRAVVPTGRFVKNADGKIEVGFPTEDTCNTSYCCNTAVCHWEDRGNANGTIRQHPISYTGSYRQAGGKRGGKYRYRSVHKANGKIQTGGKYQRQDTGPYKNANGQTGRYI